MATIRFFAAAKAATGVSQIEITAASLGQALELVGKKYPELLPVLSRCSYLINEVSCQDLSTVIKQADIVDVLPPFAGG